MRLTCTSCGSIASLDTLIAHDGAREAVMIALQLPAPLGKLLVYYVALFRPAHRQLSLDRLASLLGELLPMIQDGKVERAGRIWPAPLDVWKAALEDMIAKRDKLTLPLKSHGYLLEIIAGQASKADAAAEAGKETAARGITPVGAHASHRGFKPKAVVTPTPEKARAGLDQVKSALKGKQE